MMFRVVSCILVVACFVHAAAAQENPLDVQAFLPAAATLKQQLSLADADGPLEVLVYSAPDPPGADVYHAEGIRVLEYDPVSGWAVAFEEAVRRMGRHCGLSVQKLQAADGHEAVLVIRLHSGVGTTTNWHVVAPIHGEVVKLDPAAERAKVLGPREYVDNGYNTVKSEGERIVETLPGYTRGRARCCPNRPKLEMTFNFTGSSIVLDTIEELRHPAAPPALLGPLLRLNENGLWSYGYEVSNGFLVLEGGESPKDHSPSTPEAIVALRKSLLEQGVLFDDRDHLRLTQNYEFTSSSVAASVMLARPAEGSTEWKDEYGQEAAAGGGSQEFPPN